MIFARILPVLLLQLAVTAPAAAAQVRPHEFAQVYTDLPGVSEPAPLNAPSRVECEQVVVKRSVHGAPTRGPLYDTFYSCRRDGGPLVEGRQLPPSLERQNRGLDY